MPIDGAKIQRAGTAEEIYNLWLACDEAIEEDILTLLANQTIAVLSRELNLNPDYLSPQNTKYYNQIKVLIGDLHQNRISKLFASVHSSHEKALTKIQNSLYSLEILHQKNQKIYEYLKLASPTEIQLKEMERLADSLIKEFKNNVIEIGFLVSYALQLYEKAADGYRQKGQFDRVMDICKKTSDHTLILSLFPLKKIQNLSDSIKVDHPILGTLDYGVNFPWIGGGLVKGENLCAKESVLDGKQKKEISFKLNYWAADRLRAIIKSFQKQEMIQALQDSGLCSKATLTTHDKYYYYPKEGNEFTSKNKLEMGSATTIHLEGLATIKIGTDPLMGSMYNLVKVELDPSASIEHIHKALAIIGLSQLMSRSKPEDIERLKINTLFHTYFPREAFELERKASFYLLPLDELKNNIIKAAPGMRKILAEKLSLVETYENVPGEIHCLIPNAASEVKALGGRGLICGVSGNVREAARNIACMCRSGLLSSQARFDNGLLIHGASSIKDHQNNSADSIFMRAVTQYAIDDQTTFTTMSLRGSYQIVLKLDVYNLAPYVHENDYFGCRNPSDPDYGEKYQNRWSFLEHTVKNQLYYVTDNEVNLPRGRLDSAYIAGFPYQDPRRTLLKDLLSVNPSFFPSQLVDDKQKMAYIEQHPQLVLDELKRHPNNFILEPNVKDPNDMTYLGMSILNHWTQDPKKVLLEELRKVGFQTEFNLVKLEDLIREKDYFDEETFRPCHEHITPSDL